MHLPPYRYVSAAGPVSPRVRNSALPGVRHAGDATPRRAWRAQLGPGLRHEWRDLAAPAARWTARRIAVGVLLCVLAALIVAAWPSTWMPLAAMALGATAVVLRLARRSAGAATLDLECAELDAFDQLLAEVAADLDARHLALLRDLKAALVRLARGRDDDPVQLEDRAYLAACVRRYVPALLRAFVAVPAAVRSAPIDAGCDALEVLAQELALILSDLQARERRIAARATRELLQARRAPYRTG